MSYLSRIYTAYPGALFFHWDIIRDRERKPRHFLAFSPVVQWWEPSLARMRGQGMNEREICSVTLNPCNQICVWIFKQCLGRSMCWQLPRALFQWRGGFGWEKVEEKGSNGVKKWCFLVPILLSQRSSPVGHLFKKRKKKKKKTQIWSIYGVRWLHSLFQRRALENKSKLR